MAENLSCTVVEPLTSNELRDRIFNAMASRHTGAGDGLVRLTVLAAEQQVPPPAEIVVRATFRQVHDNDLRPLWFVGQIADSTDEVIIQLANDGSEPAAASMVA